MDKEKIIKKIANKIIQEEIKYLIEVSDEGWEEQHTVETAFDYIADKWETEPFARNNILDIKIALGYYSPISEETYQSVVSSHDKRRAFPKRKGIRYEWVK